MLAKTTACSARAISNPLIIEGPRAPLMPGR
jgi:hypothetical protein